MPCSVEFVAPDSAVLAIRIATLDPVAFYHEVLPVFGEWPDLTEAPPSSASDGYAWMKVLAQWMSSYREV